MKLTNLQIFCGIMIALGAALSLVAVGILSFWASSFGGPLEIIARYQFIIWALLVSAIAACRAYLEHRCGISYRLLSRIIVWILIVTVAYLVMCWIDIAVNPHDNFITVFAFGLLIFLVPSLVVSIFVYALVATYLNPREGQ